MAALDSGLEKIGQYGAEGWHDIHDANVELSDQRLQHMFNATNIAGTSSVSDAEAATSEELTDSTTGTESITIGDVGATYDQSTLNNINASFVDQINKLVADNAELKTQLNNLLAELRRTNGCGILND